MKKLFLFIPVFVVVLAGVFYLNYDKEELGISVGEKITGQYATSNSVDINYDNLAEHLSKNSVVRDLPDNTKILLRFYNFDSGSRIFEKSFVLTNSGVSEDYISDADLVLMIHSKYLNEWNSRNFCGVMSKANRNGDLGIESSLSTVKLLWKFKSMNKHKSCFDM
ncbi:hypothetical protein K8R33_02220 [archaeon]|nr:hypothetical protein [archaeon]